MCSNTANHAQRGQPTVGLELRFIIELVLKTLWNRHCTQRGRGGGGGGAKAPTPSPQPPSVKTMYFIHHYNNDSAVCRPIYVREFQQKSKRTERTAMPETEKLQNKVSCRREAARCFESLNISLSHSRLQGHWNWHVAPFDKSHTSSYWGFIIKIICKAQN